jgi:hypothetical protein
LRAGRETAIEQGACATRFTGIESGLPFAELPKLSVPIIVTTPVYVFAVSVLNIVPETVM